MTEAEWLACTNPTPMLEFLQGKASDRKLRLFACAYCQWLWPLLVDERSRNAVVTTECFVDGLSGIDEMHTACAEAVAAVDAVMHQSTVIPFGVSAHSLADLRVRVAAAQAVAELTQGNILEAMKAVGQVGAECVSHGHLASAKAVQPAMQAAVLRDIFGNPFRLPAVNPSWQTSKLAELAQSIYDEQAFDRLPILADVLAEEAGCTNAEILAHCHEPGEHFRGCWVLDLLLGKG